MMGCRSHNSASSCACRGRRIIGRQHLRARRRSLKYEDVYLAGYANLIAARKGISNRIEFYNSERPHQSLKSATPLSVSLEGAHAQRLECAMETTAPKATRQNFGAIINKPGDRNSTPQAGNNGPPKGGHNNSHLTSFNSETKSFIQQSMARIASMRPRTSHMKSSGALLWNSALLEIQSRLRR